MPRTFLKGLALTLLLGFALSASVRSAEPTITLHAKNVPLTTVLQQIATRMQVRLVAPPGLFALVTVHWDNVPCSRALQELARQCRFTYAVAQGQLRLTLVPAIPPVANTTTPVNRPNERATYGVVSASPKDKSGGCYYPMQEKEEDEFRRPAGEFNTESYAHQEENPFLAAQTNPLSTFSIDVDTASYANVRRMLALGQKPPKGAVRLEELINYFNYDYPDPEGGVPFSVTTESAACPWAPKHTLLSIGVQGMRVPNKQLPPRNLVFLIDVSGSMQPANKLPLLKQSLMALLQTLDARDRVSIVVYAGSSGLVLQPTSGARKDAIRESLARLEAGGSTNGASGLELAYKTAQATFQKNGINRVILCTDGDFNVGTTSQSDLVQLIEEKRKSGVFLSVLGFGMGNYKDSTMELLADKGNGNYAYIDSLNEARKVLVEQGGGTLMTIAKDVKLQIEFNPAKVGGYRLLGYENRILRSEDFNNDKKDAGEIGAGQSVTALYELIPPGEPIPDSKVDALKYQKPAATSGGGEIATVKVRYKAPDGDVSKLLEFPVSQAAVAFEKASTNLRFSTSVASFGMLLRESAYKGDTTYAQVLQWAESARGDDREGYRAEFVKLVQNAASLASGR